MDIIMCDAQDVAVLVDDLVQSFDIQKGTDTVKNHGSDFSGGKRFSIIIKNATPK